MFMLYLFVAYTHLKCVLMSFIKIAGINAEVVEFRKAKGQFEQVFFANDLMMGGA